ncbi:MULTISPECIES: amidohydrolase family protein [unclassified Novosphingobium]|jgi:N-acyl-D-amino-acid deacylase|uniref:N-acyl-D-amino-acid deacylase family protein n=1 Tax=unclassified Novosphingobium TaxID=2644732 RepID=UPI00061BC46D|nr:MULTISPECIES: amidohydrolase family protein [unclassified Novosphingobium]GAO53331.1 D-aminoacylase [Novosphingobium sp. MD-1]
MGGLISRQSRIIFPARVVLALASALAFAGPAGASTLITGATVYDGSGAAGQKVSVRVDGDRIVAVGDLPATPADTVIRGDGLALAPGFIDSHSHHDRGDYADRAMPVLLAQGVTTVVVGQDGGSDGPFAETAARFAARPAAVNVTAYTGHGYLREKVMGEDYKRTATPAEVTAMQALLDADLKAGSLGLSTGLEYDPGIYSDHGELLALARTTQADHGRYISHMRNEDLTFDAALDELLDLGEKTGVPVQISHLKLGLVDRWGDAGKVLAKLDAARARGIKVTADVYPYEYWQSTLTVLFPKRDFTDIAAARFALTHLTTPAGMLLGFYAPNPAYVGHTIADIAAERHEEPAATYLWLIQTAQAWRKAHPDADRVEAVIGTAMSPADVADFIAWPNSNICSDGMVGSRHPRGAGAFAKVLRLYVREQHRLTLPEAIHKMTALSAEHIGLEGRGLIKPGYKADLVLFNPDTIADHATVENPGALATGVSDVMVNGVMVYREGKATGSYPGQFLKRGGL